MHNGTFHGWRVVGAAFVLAAFGLGFGCYGPPVYLEAVRERNGWSVSLISAAVTMHFLIGAAVTANLPALYQRFGIAAVTKTGALALAIGVLGWSIAAEPWQLFGATVLSGAGWVTMGIAAANAMVSPWFVRRRPAALAIAYNGANAGGIIFSPLWAGAISAMGFPVAATAVGLTMVLTTWALAALVLSREPQQEARLPDEVSPTETRVHAVQPLPGALLWRDRRFLTLAAGMSVGLFAQIGLIAHLYSLLLPSLGARYAGPAVGLVTAMAILGRTLLGWLMPARTDRRLVAVVSYAVQIVGSIAFLVAGGSIVPLLVLGIVLFGLGFGNGTFLPPLIAQAEFAREDVSRVVSLIVAISQATYSLAPATFGMIREFLPGGTDWAIGAASNLCAAAALMQTIAICAFLAGRR